MSRTPPISRISSFVACMALVACAGAAAADTEVTTCGQETSGPATLNADLDCTGFDGYALTMHGGTLAMNGHTITGGIIGVQCDRTCKIVGPGTVTGSSFAGVNAFEVGLHMSTVDVTNNPVLGVQVWNQAAIDGPAVFSGNGAAIRVGTKAKLKGLTITGNDGAVEAANNAKTGSISVQGSTITDNGSGLAAQRAIRVADSTVTGNGTFGIFAAGGSNCERKAGASIVGSTVTGNGTDPACGSSQVCADVATCRRRPRVKPGATCGTSYMIGSGNPGSDWDVCTLD